MTKLRAKTGPPSTSIAYPIDKARNLSGAFDPFTAIRGLILIQHGLLAFLRFPHALSPTQQAGESKKKTVLMVGSHKVGAGCTLYESVP